MMCHSIIIILISHYYCIVNEYDPGDHFTMKALVTLECRMNIPVLSNLQLKFSDLRDQIKLPAADTSAKPFSYRKLAREQKHRERNQYNASTVSPAVIQYIDRWINCSDCVLEPTWRNFFRVLRDTSPELGQLSYQIKELFHGRLLSLQ